MKAHITLALFAAASLCGCYSDPQDVFSFTGSMARPHSSTIGAAVVHTVVQSPEGITRLPDGGAPRIKTLAVKFYIIDVATSTVRISFSFKNPNDPSTSFGGKVDGFRGDDSAYVTVCSDGNCVGSRYIATHYLLVTGEYPVRVDAIPQNIEAAWPSGNDCRSDLSCPAFWAFEDTLSMYVWPSGALRPLFVTRGDDQILPVH